MKIKPKSTGSSVSSKRNSGDDELDLLTLIGRALEDNPDLPESLIEDILRSLAEAKDGQISDYEFLLPGQ
jgi:hypothetical protein